MVRHFIAATPLAFALAAEGAFVTTTYVGADNGSWTIAGNWSPAVIPNNGADTFHAVVSFAGNVVMPSAINVTEITTGPLSTITINNGVDPTITGPLITNDGVIVIGSTGSTTRFQLNDPVVTLAGGGFLQGTNTTVNGIWSVNVVRRLINGADHTIRGAMSLGLANTNLTNHGTIDATLPAGIVLTAQAGVAGNFNTGLMRASTGSTLTIAGSGLDNTGGVLLADGGSLHLSGTTILNGLFRDENGGALRITSNSTLQHPTIDDATLRVNNGVDPAIEGTVTNEGILSIESTGSTTRIGLNTPDVFFTGTGVVEGTNTTVNGIWSINAVRRLTNEADHTIRGAMSLGLANTNLTNHGTIDATLPAGIVVSTQAGVGANFNTGLMRASTGSTLTIAGSGLDNTGGVLLADGGSLHLSGTTILNGLFRDENGGALRITSNSTLQHPTIDDAILRINNGVDPTIEGTVTNEGIVSIESTGSTTRIGLNTPDVLFTGTGVVEGTNTTVNGIWSVGVVRRLTNGANHTIRGAMSLGLANTNLTNHGLIDATQSAGIVLSTVGGVDSNINDGLMRASAGSTLTLSGTNINNAGGVILAAGGNVGITSSHVRGGTLDSTGAGLVQIGGSASLEDLTNSGELRTNNGVDPVLYGTITNNGSWLSASSGSTTSHQLNSPIVTLDGVGELSSTNTQLNRFISAGSVRRLVNGLEHTIRGSMNIGSGNTELTNLGRILADLSGGMTIDVNSDFQNAGLLEVVDTGSLVLAPGGFVNTGTVTIEPTRTLTRQGNTYQQDAGLTTVNGTLAAPGLQVALAGGLLTGDGLVTTSLLNNTAGTIAPGFPVGQLDVTGPVTFGAASSFDVQVGGPSRGDQVDRLAATGVATLNGTIIVTRAYGYLPGPREEFTVLTASSRVGEFTTVESCEPVIVIYTANSVKVRFPESTGIVGDLDGSGTVDGSDLGILLSNWGPCEELCCFGDLDGDEQVDGSDLGVLLSNWG